MKRKVFGNTILLTVLIISLLLVALTSCASGTSVTTTSIVSETTSQSTAAPETSEPVQTTQTELPATERPAFNRDTYPRVDGSTATIPLSENLAAELLSMTSQEVKQFIKHNTTHNAYVNLIDGKADIIFVTEPSPDELSLAKSKGVEFEVVPVVKEAFVFLVNVENPVDVITQNQIQEIYQGKVTNWKALGGPDKDIIAYQRPDNSGSQTLMQSLVMKDLQLAKAPMELKPEEMSGLIEVIASYDNSDRAIGYSVYYFANSMYSKDTIKFIKVDGVEPDPENISNGTYPYTSAYYAVLRKSEPQDTSARKLLAWLLSADGQKLAEDSGYVPLKLVNK